MSSAQLQALTAAISAYKSSAHKHCLMEMDDGSICLLVTDGKTYKSTGAAGVLFSPDEVKVLKKCIDLVRPAFGAKHLVLYALIGHAISGTHKGTRSLALECHCMFYQWDSDSFLSQCLNHLLQFVNCCESDLNSGSMSSL